MLDLATALVNWSAILKIVVASLIGGAGCAIAFGLVILGVTQGRRAQNAGGRIASSALSSVAGAFCLSAVVIGCHAMTAKPS